MTDRREQFPAGERPDDVAPYLSESFLDDPEPLAEHGELVDGGIVLVVDGAEGHRVFRRATGTEAMAFAKEAMGTDGTVAPDLTGGTCPESRADEDRGALFVFAFAGACSEEAGGLHAEGDVVHAHAQCA